MDGLVRLTFVFGRERKTTMRSLKALLIAALATTISISAFADIKNLRTSAEGAATFELDGKKIRVDRVEVNLETNKKFEVTISSRSQSFKFQGEWAPFGDHRAILRIKSSSLSAASGGGNLTVDDRSRLTQIEVKGKSRSGDFHASIDITRDEKKDDDAKGGPEISSTIKGDGFMRVGGSSVGLRQLGAKLQRNGVIDLYFVSDKGSEVRLRGRWFERRGKAYDILISDIDNPSKIEARGVLDMYSRNEIDKIEIDGRQGKESFEVSFKSTERANPRQGQPGNWNFNSERRGIGDLRARNDLYDIEKSRVRLNDNGTFEVTVWTTKEYKYSGTWRRDGDDAKLLITKGGIGTGTVRVKGRDWERLSLEVIDDGTKFSIRFEAK
jgi:hypothetical protein